MSQMQYLMNLLSSSDMINLKPSVTPMVPNVDLRQKRRSISNLSEFRRIIGSLQYLTLTRLDIQFAVNKLSQFMASPENEHWIAMKRILQYLSGTLSYGVIIYKMVDRGITTYFDVNWGGDAVNSRFV